MGKTNRKTDEKTCCAASREGNKESRRSPIVSGNRNLASKGPIGRWLDRLAGINEREFGSRGPCCH